MRLSQANLVALPSDIARPTYDRVKLKPGIVHIGLGNFHRAHQAWYLHRLMQKGLDLDWAIVGSGVRPNDEAQRIMLAEQDYLTTLIELDPKGHSAEVVGSMIDFVPVEQDNASLISRMAEANIRIVSLTVTEGGYYIHPVTKRFNAEHADILHDIAHPGAPKTAFGAIVESLRRRRDSGAGPFTLQSCDNLQGNGTILRQTILGLAQKSDLELAAWIEENCSFPNSMVDCIVPATGKKELDFVRGFGVSDAVPVTHEKFRQWVIEDEFCAGRPSWEKVGATLTDDVQAYEAMKIGILNGGHQLIANAGEILSICHISDCMTHPLVGAFFRKVASEEIAPHINAVPGMTPNAYVDLVDQRFANPEIVDTVRRVAFDGSSRHAGFLLPILREALKSGKASDGLVLSQALWARMCAGTREDGSAIEPNDPHWDNLLARGRAAKTHPLAWISQSDIYGDLIDDTHFCERFEMWLSLIWSEGAEAALCRYLEG